MKINSKLTLAFLLISVIPLVVTSILAYLTAEKALTQAVLDHLESDAVTQEKRIESIVAQNLERLALVSSRTQLRLSLESLVADPSNIEHQAKINRILRDARSSISTFKEISVLSPNGDVVASADLTKIGAPCRNEEFFLRGLKESSADIFFIDEDQNLRVYLSGPLYLENKLLGVVVIISEVDNIIALTQDHSGLGETGETLLARRDEQGDALFVTPLRFDQEATLKRTVSKKDLDVPITQALLKKEQLWLEATDYRGEFVLAATRYIEETDWGLVVKIDEAEAFAPINELRNLLIVIILVSSLIVVLISVYIARSITGPIIDLTRMARKIGTGDLSQRAKVTSTDEIGILAQAFNQTAEELIKANTELRESENRFRGIIESTQAGYFYINRDGLFQHVNDAWLQLHGYSSPDAVIGQHFALTQVETDMAQAQQDVEKLLSGDAIPVGELARRCKDGSIGYHTFSASPVVHSGEIVGLEGFLIDITERKQAEEALREAHEQLSATLNALPDLLFEVDRDGRIYDFRAPHPELLYTAPEKFLGRTMSEVLPREAANVITEAIAEAVKTGQHAGGIYPLRTPAGPGWFELSIATKGDPMAPDVRLITLVHDITKRKQTEEALRESEKRYKRLLGSVTDYIYTVQVKNGRAVATSHGPGCLAVTGYTPEEYEADPHLWYRMVYEEDRPAIAEQANKALSGTVVSPLEHRITHKDGTIRWVRNTPVPRYDERGRFVAYDGLIADITERKQAEEELRRRNRELALLNHASQAFSSTLNLNQVLDTILEEVRHLLGVVASSAWLIDPKTDELVCRHATIPQSELVRGWRLAPSQGLAGWVVQHRESLIVPDVRADERHFEGVDEQTRLALRSILTVPLQVKQEVIGVIQAVDTEVDRFRSTDLALVEPLAVTAAIAIENARLYEQARHDAETKAILLNEANHRVKNNLTAIIGLLYTEQSYAREREDAVYQAIMKNLINRVQGLSTVHSLLSASEWEPLRLSNLVEQIIRSSLRIVPRDKRVSVNVTPSPVQVTPSQAHDLALVINELATNTVKHALPGRDTAQITVHITRQDNTVRCQFRDDGPGYPEEVLQLERHNVGLDLTKNIVRSRLRGELSLHNDCGAVTIIQFKTRVSRNGNG